MPSPQNPAPLFLDAANLLWELSRDLVDETSKTTFSKILITTSFFSRPEEHLLFPRVVAVSGESFTVPEFLASRLNISPEKAIDFGNWMFADVQAWEEAFAASPARGRYRIQHELRSGLHPFLAQGATLLNDNGHPSVSGMREPFSFLNNERFKKELGMQLDALFEDPSTQMPERLKERFFPLIEAYEIQKILFAKDKHSASSATSPSTSQASGDSLSSEDSVRRNIKRL